MTTPMTVEAPDRTRRLNVIEHGAKRSQHALPGRTRLGPLLAVCGLAGGAGATTLAYLVALTAARQWPEPVMVADTGGPSGGLAALAGLEAPHSLPELALHLAVGLPLRGGLYATGPAGLRVLGAGPTFSARCMSGQLMQLLIDAREAHELTVIDCGTLARELDEVVVAAATHLAWVVRATRHGVSGARRVLAAAPPFSAREIVVARADVGEAKAPVRELRRLATERHAPLVLVPHLAELEKGRLDRALQTAQIPLQAILGALTR